jgi:hypothetical protein
MIRPYLFFSFCFFSALVSAQVNYKPDPSVDIIHYEFNIILNDTTDMIDGTALIDINFKEMVTSFEFDLKNINSFGKGMKISDLSFNGSGVKWGHTTSKGQLL